MSATEPLTIRGLDDAEVAGASSLIVQLRTQLAQEVFVARVARHVAFGPRAAGSFEPRERLCGAVADTGRSGLGAGGGSRRFGPHRGLVRSVAARVLGGRTLGVGEGRQVGVVGWGRGGLACGGQGRILGEERR